MGNAKLATALIYIAASLPDGEEVEHFTLRAANSWEVGRSGTKDGLVIFIFMKQKEVRIELGRDLEAAISNEAAKRVIDNQIVPAFRNGSYGSGLLSAVDSLTALLRRGSSS